MGPMVPRGTVRRLVRDALGGLLVLAGTAVSLWGGSAATTHALVSLDWGAWTQFSQQEAKWCWAAGAKMMIDRAQGWSPSQCDLVRAAKRIPDCADESATMTEVAKVLSLYGVATDGVEPGVPSFAVIRSRTTTACGVLVRVQRPIGSRGHIAPLIGSSSHPDRVYVTYIRTTGVSGGWVAYSQFADGTAGLGATTYTPTHYLASSGGDCP